MPSAPRSSASQDSRALSSTPASATSVLSKDSPPHASRPARRRHVSVARTGSRTSISTRRCFAACCTASSPQPPAKMRKPLSENAGDDGEACGAIRAETARCPIHVPSQDPSGAQSPSPSTRPDTRRGLLRASIERLLLQRTQGHHPAGVIDVPPARAAARAAPDLLSWSVVFGRDLYSRWPSATTWSIQGKRAGHGRGHETADDGRGAAGV